MGMNENKYEKPKFEFFESDDVIRTSLDPNGSSNNDVVTPNWPT